MTHPNATPGKAIYLDGVIYEGVKYGKPQRQFFEMVGDYDKADKVWLFELSKCDKLFCPLPHPFTNYQEVVEGVDYVKQRQIRALGLTEWNNCTQKEYETTYSFPQERRIIALPLQRNITAGLEIDQVKEWQEIKNKQAEKLTTDEFRRVVEEAARTKSTYIFKEPTELQAEKREGEKESKLVFEVGAPVDFNSPEMKKEIERIHEHIKDIMEAAKVDTSKLHIKFNVC